MHFRDVFEFLTTSQSEGKACVLVTVCAVEGSSMRNPGTVMGVAEDGRFAGSLSGGCIENAVVAEAIEALKSNAPRIVRFGAGSPFLDIKLPCGGGLDVHFQPLDQRDFATQCLAAIDARQPFSICISKERARFEARWQAASFDVDAGTGVFGHWPAPLLQIIGHGATVEALASLGAQMGYDIVVLTPDDRILDAFAGEQWLEARKLAKTTDTGFLKGDAWTANVFLFHDHDWEIDLMQHAMQLPHFYLGAMGGRKAHAMRSEALSARGVSQQSLDTIHAPIGLFHSSRDPQSLALSALAEITRAYHATDFAAGHG